MAILDYDFRDYGTIGLFQVRPSAELMLISNLVQIGRTVSNLFNFFSKFQFFVDGHLAFWKMTVSTRPVSGRCQDEAPRQIW